MSAQMMLSEGSMARHVVDVRVGLLTIAGAHDRDPRSLPVTLTDRAQNRPLRVAVASNPPAGVTHPEIVAAITNAADALATSGAQVTEVVPPSFARAIHLWGVILSEEIRAQRPLLDLVMGEDGKKFLSYADDIYPPVDTAALMMAFTERNTLDRQWHEFLTQYDVLLMPTWTQPPFQLGADVVTLTAAKSVLETIRPVLPANLLGLPAAVVPVGMADGMPVGAQLVGRKFADLTCLNAAELLESHFGTITPIDPIR
jgi:amidase